MTTVAGCGREGCPFTAVVRWEYSGGVTYRCEEHGDEETALWLAMVSGRTVSVTPLESPDWGTLTARVV